MKQWNIINEIYNLIFLRVNSIKYPSVNISVVINDLCQCVVDRTGQKVIFEEKQYEPPAMFEMSISVRFEGKNINDLLKAYGEVVVLLKDNPELDIGNYAWHGSITNKIYLHPIVRNVNHGRIPDCEGLFKYELVYSTEFSINSHKSYEFKRVEKREIRGIVKE